MYINNTDGERLVIKRIFGYLIVIDCSDSVNFVCRDGSQLIARDGYCNGEVDCFDASDEPAVCGKYSRSVINENVVVSAINTV